MPAPRRLPRRLRPRSGSANDHVEPVAEALHIARSLRGSRHLVKTRLGFAPDLRCAPPAASRSGWSRSSAGVPICVDLAQMHQRHAMAALGFIQIGSRDKDRQGRRPRGARAYPRIRGAIPDRRPWSAHRAAALAAAATSAQASASFCFMPPLSRPASRSVKAVHVEHAQIALAALVESRCGGTRRRSPM